MDEPFTIHVTSLGCPKNLTDTEHVLAQLSDSLGKIEFTSETEDARLILVNTCAFIEEAVSESIDTILGLCQDKRAHQRLVVFGCLPLRYGKELEDLIPEVDLFVFHVEPSRVGAKILEFLHAGHVSTVPDHERIITGYPWQAYVKISDGCSNRCTYCLIPKIRGNLRCRNPESIVSEIKRAVTKGAKEITLVAQDLSSYSHGRLNLPGLLELILSETDVPWLRLMYLYPSGIDENLLKLIASEDRICNYLDIPIQHASSRILRKMGRDMDETKLHTTMELVRKHLPDASLRTTVMVGFPGEDESDFKVLIDFIRRWRFHHLGCFTYFDEQEAASSRLKEKVNKETARVRKKKILEQQKEIALEINKTYVGKELRVLVDGYCEESDLLLCARTTFQAPEIDGITYINRGKAEAGSFATVKVTKAHHYDLIGEIIY